MTWSNSPKYCGEVVLGVAVCTGGADTDLSVDSAGEAVDNWGLVGSGLSGSVAGWIHLLCLMHLAPELVCTV